MTEKENKDENKNEEKECGKDDGARNDDHACSRLRACACFLLGIDHKNEDCLLRDFCSDAGLPRCDSCGKLMAPGTPPMPEPLKTRASGKTPSPATKR
jgi:hypothetical protein